MFAFALWDRQERQLHLVRDRLGKKPLYYGLSGGRLIFASELKAIMACPGFRPEVDRDALTAYFRYQYVPAPRSIWRGISKLPPGHSITIDRSEEHTSELQSLMRISYAVFCLKKKTHKQQP